MPQVRTIRTADALRSPIHVIRSTAAMNTCTNRQNRER